MTIPRHMARLLLLLALGARQALGTAPQRPEYPWEGALAPSRPTRDLSHGNTREMPQDLGPFCWLREYEAICGFLADWQVQNPASANHGGMIEAEAGPLGNVIQTDNTLEAIWVWSARRAWTDRADHDANIQAAWIYCDRFPAWAEEGSVGDNYYRAHNCAWGLAACQAYEAATGDTTRRAYARTCGNYIATHPLSLSNANSLNAMVTGWCAGSLHDAALWMNRVDWREASREQGLDLLDFVEENPAQWLAWDEWAMSGGTMLWGLCRSVFTDAPLYGEQWLQDHVFQVPDWSDWHNVAGYDWDGSWNVAYANGLFAVADAVGDPVSAERARIMVGGLLSLDTDDDGGIRADSQDPDTEDMSWVSCYLARFGLARLVGTPPTRDAMPLRLHGLRDESVVVQGQPLQLAVVVANAGVEDLASVTVELEVDGQLHAQVSALSYGALDTLWMSNWTPQTGGRHRLVLRTICAQDEVPVNDLLEVDLLALAPPVAQASPREKAAPWARLRGGVLELESPCAGKAVVEVVNLLGQRVGSFTRDLPAGRLQSVPLRDQLPALATGRYLLRVETEGQAMVLPFTRLP